MGKIKKTLDSALDHSEQQTLRKFKQEKLQEIERQIASKYHDGFNKSLMMSDEATKTMNEIQRKIRLYKAKRTQMEDLTRKKKEEILTERNNERRNKSMFVPHTTSCSTLQST